MSRLLFASLAACMITAAPAAAQDDAPGRPLTNRDPDAMDVATTPMSDLNLRKDEIPQLLIDAQSSPYDLNGLENCGQLAARIGEFDAVLGDDLDLPQTPGQRISAGRIGQVVVGSFIPFRGLIREVSGANDQRRRVDAAISAGFVRRAFLKGVGQQQGCLYPARSATREVWDQHVSERQQGEEKPKPARKVADAGRRY